MIKLAILGLLLTTAIVSAQNVDPAPLFTSDLVAWSSMSAPAPMPQITGPTQKTLDPATNLSMVSFSGKIAKRGGEYFLQSSDSTSYRLDHPEVASLYEGMQVLVLGALDPSGSLHIRKVAQVH
jgi:hypothetical protein